MTLPLQGQQEHNSKVLQQNERRRARYTQVLDARTSKYYCSVHLVLVCIQAHLIISNI